MKINPNYIFVAVTMLLLSKAGFSQGFRPVTDPTTPVRGIGFSVQPPPGDNWLVGVDPRSGTVVFGKASPEHKKLRGSVIVSAALIKAQKSDIGTPEGLRAEVDEWVRASSSRFTLVNLKLEPYRDKDQGTDCVRVVTTSEERNNPNRPTETLLITVSGKACRHTLSPTHYVQVIYSERRPIDSLVLVDNALRSECDSTVESLKFLRMP